MRGSCMQCVLFPFEVLSFSGFFFHSGFPFGGCYLRFARISASTAVSLTRLLSSPAHPRVQGLGFRVECLVCSV